MFSVWAADLNDFPRLQRNKLFMGRRALNERVCVSGWMGMRAHARLCVCVCVCVRACVLRHFFEAIRNAKTFWRRNTAFPKQASGEPEDAFQHRQGVETFWIFFFFVVNVPCSGKKNVIFLLVMVSKVYSDKRQQRRHSNYTLRTSNSVTQIFISWVLGQIFISWVLGQEEVSTRSFSFIPSPNIDFSQRNHGSS